MAAVVMAMAMACGPAVSDGPVAPGDAAVDAGRSVGDWQSDSALAWRSEMGSSHSEMQDALDANPTMFDAAGREMFYAATREYLAARRTVAPDAGLAERRAMVVHNTADDIAPAYCRCAAAFRVAALGHPLRQPEPRVRCSELPVSDASRWWERWP
jgi:hypothetical protein